MKKQRVPSLNVTLCTMAGREATQVALDLFRDNAGCS